MDEPLRMSPSFLLVCSLLEWDPTGWYDWDWFFDAVVALKRWGRKTLDDMNNTRLDPITELDDGKIYRKALYLMVKTMVSCRFSLKPIHWSKHIHKVSWKKGHDWAQWTSILQLGQELASSYREEKAAMTVEDSDEVPWSPTQGDLGSTDALTQARLESSKRNTSRWSEEKQVRWAGMSTLDPSYTGYTCTDLSEILWRILLLSGTLCRLPG